MTGNSGLVQRTSAAVYATTRANLHAMQCLQLAWCGDAAAERGWPLPQFHHGHDDLPLGAEGLLCVAEHLIALALSTLKLHGLDHVRVPYDFLAASHSVCCKSPHCCQLQATLG
jgi:hypothetical protein